MPYSRFLEIIHLQLKVKATIPLIFNIFDNEVCG